MSYVCWKTRRQLAAYRHRELSAPVRSGVQRHLASCPRCRRALSTLQGIERQLRDMPSLEADEALRADIHGGATSRVDTQPRSSSLMVAGAMLTLVAIVFLLVRVSAVPRLALMPLAALAPHEGLARELHERRLQDNLPLDISSSEVSTLKTWTAQQIALDPEFAAQNVPTPEGRIRFVGATRVPRRPAVLFHLEVGEKPVSLLMQPRSAESVDEGFWAKHIYFRKDGRTGRKALTWTTKDISYVLVSELSGFGQAGCLTCHTDADRRAQILAMRPWD